MYIAYLLRVPAEHQVQIGGSLRHERVQRPTGAPLDGQGDPKRDARQHGLPRYWQLRCANEDDPAKKKKKPTTKSNQTGNERPNAVHYTSCRQREKLRKKKWKLRVISKNLGLAKRVR